MSLLNYFPGVSSGKLRCLASLLLTLIPMTVSAQQPLKFVGFDKSSHSSAAHEGLMEILSGRLFHSGMPLKAIQAISQAAGTRPKTSYDPNSPQGQYYATGKIPSPPNRESKLALGDSMFVRNGVTLINGNCFYCHAGVVRGLKSLSGPDM